MKLIFIEYLASLKERGELDVIMPDLLSEIGMNVISRPAVGTKQYGVDIAAVGTGSDGVRRLFLLSVKPGDLRRSGWDVGEQSLRTSLNQILDVYVRNHIPKRYAGLPVVIVLCIGGDLHEDVRADVDGFMDRHTESQITFDLWNGDRLAEMLLSGILREKAFPKTRQSTFRKSVAMVDEPDVSFGHFCRFVTMIAESCKANRRARLTAIRQIYLGLWTLYVWARVAENIEAAYLSSERALLVSWQLIKNHLSGRSREARQLNQSMMRLVTLHDMIADDYLASYVTPRANIQHGLTSAIPSQSSLDINLRLFDLVGRIGIRGLWQMYLTHALERESKEKEAEAVRKSLYATAELLANVLQNNPILCTPIRDSHAIDINIACLFLKKVGCNQIIQNWIHQVARATVFAFNSNGPYPCVFEDYRDLIEHPKDDGRYRVEATAGSLLVPTLAVWAAFSGDVDTLICLGDFASGPYAHSTLQLWYPGSDTEEHLYLGSAAHGLAATHIRIEHCPDDMLSQIKSECAKSAAFLSLSPLAYGLWPLIILASRHHRVPVPPHFWPLSHAEAGSCSTHLREENTPHADR